MRPSVMAMLLASSAAALAACRDGPVSPATGGCHIAALGTCSEYPDGAPPLYSPASCARVGGDWVAACPVEGRLGTCVFTVSAEPGGASLTASETFYPGILATPAEAADACASFEGTFTAGTAQAGPATEQAFSCDLRAADATCTDYSGLWEPERRAAFEWVCAYDGGTVLPPGTACPTAGRTGTCRRTIGSLTRLEDVRHYDPATAAADEAACPYGWTAG